MPMTSEQEALFHQQRMSGLGGTDMAALLGEDPYQCPMDIYRQKLGLVEPIKPNYRMKKGIHMEPFLHQCAKELISDRHGGQFDVVHGDFHRHPKYPFLIGHLDGRIITAGNGSRLIGITEYKTGSRFQRTNWGDEWTDDIPKKYLIQVQHYMMVTGAPVSYVLADLDGDQLAVYVVEYSKELGEQFVDFGDDFWNNNIRKHKPPPIDGSEASAKLLKELYPVDSGEVKQADVDVIPYIGALQEQIRMKKIAETEILECQNKIKDFMGDASVLEFDGDKITWKKSKDTEKVDYKAAIDAVWGDLPAMWQNMINKAIAAQTTITPGSRRFLTPRLWSKVEDE